MVQSVLIFSIRDVRAALQSTALHIYFLGHCTIFFFVLLLLCCSSSPPYLGTVKIIINYRAIWIWDFLERLAFWRKKPPQNNGYGPTGFQNGALASTVTSRMNDTDADAFDDVPDAYLREVALGSNTIWQSWRSWSLTWWYWRELGRLPSYLPSWPAEEASKWAELRIMVLDTLA